jgi:AraC-like DNA-binding protein
MDTKVDEGSHLRFHFCRRFRIDRTRADSWVAQPFSVLAMTTRGRLELLIAGLRECLVKPAPGQVYFLPAGVRRQPHLVGSEAAEVLALGIALEFLGGLDLLPRMGIPFLPEPSARLKTQLLSMEEMEQQAGDRSLRWTVTRQALGYALVSDLLACAAPGANAPSLVPEEQRCAPAIRFMDDHCAEPLSLTRLSELCHLSRTHFFRLFKKQAGCTPFGYLRQLRLREACRMLAGTNLTVAEIGCRVGWPDPYHFSRTFKAATGMAPSHYRSYYCGNGRSRSAVTSRRTTTGERGAAKDSVGG